MKYYQELTLIGQPEISFSFILTKVYTQIHLALVEMQDENGLVPIGVSFPEYLSDKKEARLLNKSDGDNRKIGLGNKLRVFAETEDDLKQLDLLKWLSHLMDYVHLTGIREVPIKKVTGYVYFQRKHIKGSPQKLSKRHAKRHNISITESEKYYNGLQSTSDLPYLYLKSLSNDQSFRLFILKVKSNSFVNKSFRTYGLSTVSTVPEF